MGEAFSERSRWRRWAMIGGWGFVGLMVLGTWVGEASAPDKSQAAAPVDLSSVRSAYAELARPCEAAQVAVGAGLSDFGKVDRVALAGSVRRMEDACGSAWLEVDDIILPDGLTSAQEDQADAFIEQCKTAFWLRKELGEKLIPMVDGDLRPSVVAGLQADMAQMQQQVARCSTALDGFAPKAEAPASAE